MEELIEKVDSLKNSLDETEIVKDLKEKNKRILEEKELLEDIQKYQETQEEKIRERIVQHPIYREYKHSENECNFLILEINQRLKKLLDEGKRCL